MFSLFLPLPTYLPTPYANVYIHTQHLFYAQNDSPTYQERYNHPIISICRKEKYTRTTHNAV